jgi:hypothetical protein
MSKYYGLVFSNTDPSQYPSLAPTFLTFKNALTGGDVSAPTITQLSTVGVYGFTYSAAFPTYFRVDGITISSSTDRYLVGIIDPVSDVDSQLTAASATLQAIGMSNIALGMTNVAIGLTGVAIGTTAVALGTSNVALGTTSVALGTTNVALSTTIVAIGTTNFALGTTAVALGTSAVSSGITAVALGNTILALSTSNFAGNSSLLALIGDTSSSFGTEAVDPTTLFGYLKRMQEFNEGDQSFNKTSGVWTIQARNTSLIATRTLSNSSSEVTRS